MGRKSTVRRNDIFYEIYKILKESGKPLTQWQILTELKDRGYAKTTCASLFYPSILQPIPIGEKFSEPLIEQVESLNQQKFFQLGEWLNDIPENEVRQNLLNPTIAKPSKKMLGKLFG